MQVCSLLQTDNHASTPPLSFFTGQMPFLPPNQQRQSTEGKQSAIALANISSLQVVLYVQTRELPRERDNARNNARCTQARKTTHGLDGQHQDMDRTPCVRVSQNDRGQRKNGESTSMVWPTFRSRMAKEHNRTEQARRQELSQKFFREDHQQSR